MADIQTAIMDALRSVHDPCCQERGLSVVDMGLVRSVAVDDGRARVELLLTTGWCPFAANLVGSITERVNSLPGVAASSVEIVWDEPWTTDRLSDDARRKLRFLPHPNALPQPQGESGGLTSEALATGPWGHAKPSVSPPVNQGGQP
jgi:metal-sulfur cluster biosynthetic enzyme